MHFSWVNIDVTVQNKETSFIIFMNVAALKQKDKSLSLWNSLKKNTHTQKYHDRFNVSEYNIILRVAKFCKIILALFLALFK